MSRAAVVPADGLRQTLTELGLIVRSPKPLLQQTSVGARALNTDSHCGLPEHCDYLHGYIFQIIHVAYNPALLATSLPNSTLDFAASS